MRIALFVLAAFVLSIAAPVFAGPFSDVPSGHWAYKAIDKATEAGILQGYDGKFNGNKTLNRYQMAVVVSRMLPTQPVISPQTRTTPSVPGNLTFNPLGFPRTDSPRSASTVDRSGCLPGGRTGSNCGSGQYGLSQAVSTSCVAQIKDNDLPQGKNCPTPVLQR